MMERLTSPRAFRIFLLGSLVVLLGAACGECQSQHEVQIPGDHPCADKFNCYSTGALSGSLPALADRVRNYDECVKLYNEVQVFDCSTQDLDLSGIDSCDDVAAKLKQVLKNARELRAQVDTLQAKGPATGDSPVGTGWEEQLNDIVKGLDAYAYGDDGRDKKIEEAKDRIKEFIENN